MNSCDDCDLAGLSIPNLHDFLPAYVLWLGAALILWSVYRCFRSHSGWLDELRTLLSTKFVSPRYLWMGLHAAVGGVTIVMACSGVCGYLKFVQILPGDVGCILPQSVIYEAVSDYLTITSLVGMGVWIARKVSRSQKAAQRPKS